MTSSLNAEIRHRILQILYKLAQDKPASMLDRNRMQKLLNVSEEKMDFNMLYLEEKGLVKLFKVHGSAWHSVEIRAFGVDVIENKDTYGDQFPFIQTTTQEIYGDVYGTVVQAVESDVSFSQQLNTAFQQARIITEKKENIPEALKKETKKHLVLLEEELKNKEPDAGKIQKLWKWLNRNANWVVPTLTQVVLEGIKLALCS